MRLLTSLPLLALAVPALAQEAAYVDDRSTPQAVVTSYYNAISRQEYARAYSYYGSNSTPGDFDTWSNGYQNTAKVAVAFGPTQPDGAAGSTNWALPVVLSVTQTSGPHQSFSGCYYLKLVQPANQVPPFEGLHIESAKLSAGSKLPASC